MCALCSWSSWPVQQRAVKSTACPGWITPNRSGLIGAKRRRNWHDDPEGSKSPTRRGDIDVYSFKKSAREQERRNLVKRFLYLSFAASLLFIVPSVRAQGVRESEHVNVGVLGNFVRLSDGSLNMAGI